MKRMRVLTAILPYMLISFARNVVKYSIYPIVNEVKKVEQIDMNGFKVDEIHQYYKGICPACSKED